MIAVTYRQLANVETDYPGSAIMTRIEKYTGARTLYGLDTPINVLDIITNVNLNDGVLTLTYADNVIGLCQTLAIECMKASLAPWDAVFSGDTRARNLLDNMTLYLASVGIPQVPKKDYCGDPIPGFYGVIPANQLLDAHTSIKASVDALSLTGRFYTNSWWITQSAPFTAAQLAYWQSPWAAAQWAIDSQDQNAVDIVVTDHPLPLAGYVEKNIDDTLLLDPDYYFKESVDQFDMQRATSAGHETYYGIIIHKPLDGSMPGGTEGNPLSYENSAVKLLSDLLKMTYTMVVYKVNLLPFIIIGIRECMRQYVTEQRLRISGSILPRLLDLSKHGIFPNLTHESAVTIYEQQVINAGLNKRAELLRSSAYIHTFDADLSGTINSTERVNLEETIRVEMIAARKANALAAYNAAKATYDTLPQLSAGQYLVDVVTPYLL